MRKPPETILKKDHDKIVAAKNAIITELANLVDEFAVSFEGFTVDYAEIAERGKKVIKKRAVSSVAWPKR